jgi:hypothetical protein
METNKSLSIRQNLVRALVIIAVAFLLIQIRGCVQDMNTVNAPETAKLLHSDTVVKYRYITKWFFPTIKTQRIKDSMAIPMPAIVDTLAILRKFYTEYCYTDTIQDTNIIAVSEIQLAENKIRNHTLAYKLLRPEKIITVTNVIEKPFKPLLLLGVSVSQDKQFSFGIGPQIQFISKRRQSVGLGYDVVNKRVNANLYFPLQFHP